MGTPGITMGFSDVFFIYNIGVWTPTMATYGMLAIFGTCFRRCVKLWGSGRTIWLAGTPTIEFDIFFCLNISNAIDGILQLATFLIARLCILAYCDS